MSKEQYFGIIFSIKHYLIHNFEFNISRIIQYNRIKYGANVNNIYNILRAFSFSLILALSLDGSVMKINITLSLTYPNISYVSATLLAF